MQPRDWIVPMIKVWAVQKRRIACDRREGLMIQRALDRMPELPRTVMFAHYVIGEARAEEKAATLGLSRSAYYSQLELAYHYLAGRIDALAEASAA